MPRRPLSLLCIDGGGVKGLSALLIIRKLMEFIDPDNPPKPCDYFDMIGGTSAGGLIAIMLGRLEMTIDDCTKHFLEFQRRAFTKIGYSPVALTGAIKPRYDATVLEAAVKGILRANGLEEDALLQNRDQDACKVFVTATRAGTSTIEILASYPRRRGANELYRCSKIWEAARATTASSSFFDPIAIGPSGRRFFDGGTGANNPVFQLWEEAADLFTTGKGNIEDSLDCLVSIGCGVSFLQPVGENVVDLARTLVAITTETEATARRFERASPRLSERGKYFRFNAPSVGNSSVDKPEETSAIVQMTDNYIEDDKTQECLLQCALRLSQRSKPVETQQSLNSRHRQLVHLDKWSSGILPNNCRKISLNINTPHSGRFDIFNHMSQYDAECVWERLKRKICPDTTDWILTSRLFCEWLKQEGTCLAITGIVGSGKTTCTANVVTFLSNFSGRQVFHFFYETIFQDRLTGLDVLEGFLKQIIIRNSDPPPKLQQRIWDYYGGKARRPDMEQVFNDLILQLIRDLGTSPIFVIDGLDECESTSRGELVALLPKLVATGSSLFVSTRDLSELRRRFPGVDSIECSVDEPGVCRDLEVYITNLVEHENLKHEITLDNQVLSSIRRTLLKNAGAMFLWVKLLVIEIWAMCNDVEDINDYLENKLPADLSGTYARCRARVHHSKLELSRDLFKLVCGAVVPFHFEELLVMLTLTENNGELIKIRNKPSIEILIQDCGANLINRDKSGLVLPIHHSVLQFVFPAIEDEVKPQISKTEQELNIGMVCMLHIEQWTQRALVQSSASQSGYASYQDMSALGFQPFAFVRQIFGSNTDKVKQIAKPSSYLFKSPIADPTNDGVLLRYAQRSWVQSNRSLNFKDFPKRWAIFQDLAVKNRPGVTYPWPKDETHHLHGLFVWAITHGHIPLVELLLTPPNLEIAYKLDLLNKPLLRPEDGFALHYAAKIRNERLFRLLWNHVDVWKTDNDGHTALITGTLAGCQAVISLYHKTIPRRLQSKTHNRSPEELWRLRHWTNSCAQNLLHMAILSSNIACVLDVTDFEVQIHCLLQEDDIIRRWPYQRDANGHDPLSLAITHGDTGFVSGCFDVYRKIDSDMRLLMITPQKLELMVEQQKWDILEHMMCREDFDLEYPFSSKCKFPDVTSRHAQSLMELIILKRPSWIPRLLVDSWALENPTLRDFLPSIITVPGDILIDSVDPNVKLLQIYHDIIHSKNMGLPGIDSQLEEYSFSNADWPSVLAIAAMTRHELPTLSYLLDRGHSMRPFVLYEGTRLGDKEILLTLLDSWLFQWSEDTIVEAANIAKGTGDSFALTRLCESILRSPDMFFDPDMFEMMRRRIEETDAMITAPAIRDHLLWTAIDFNQWDWVKRLILREDVNIDSSDTIGSTAIGRAATAGEWDMVEWLLNQGADHSVTIDGSLSLLEYARMKGIILVQKRVKRLKPGKVR